MLELKCGEEGRSAATLFPHDLSLLSAPACSAAAACAVAASPIVVKHLLNNFRQFAKIHLSITPLILIQSRQIRRG